MLRRHIAHRLPKQYSVVRGTQRGRVANGQLVLAVAQFGIIGVNGNVLRFKGRHHVIHHSRRRAHGDRLKYNAVSSGDISAVAVRFQEGEFVFQRGLDRETLFAGARDYALRKVRGQAPHGTRSSVSMSHIMAALWGA